MAETGAITAEQAQAAAGADRLPADAAARRRLVRRLGRGPGAGAAARERRRRCCARRWTRGCRRSPRPGWRRCWTGRAPRPASRRARSWCWMPRPARCGRWSAGAITAQSPFNRAVLARRQPGSAFKPFVWLAALEKGMRPDDTVLDAPIRIGNWSPANFERRYLGEITLEEALAQSVNTAAVRLLLQAGGPRAVARLARAARASPTAAERCLARAGHRRGRAAGTDRRLCRVLQWRRAGRRRSASSVQADGRAVPRPHAGAGDRSGAGGDDGADAGRGGDARHRPRRRGAWARWSPARPAPRRITATPGSSAGSTAR